MTANDVHDQAVRLPPNPFVDAQASSLHGLGRFMNPMARARLHQIARRAGEILTVKMGRDSPPEGAFDKAVLLVIVEDLATAEFRLHQLLARIEELERRAHEGGVPG